MAIGFNIQFRINEKIDSRIIRLTDTSSNGSGFTFGKGNFSITFPDGTTINHTDFNSPDITSIGGYYDFQASSDIYNNVLTGQYVVTYVVLDSSNVAQTPLVRTITDFNWIKPSAVIQNRSDVFIPEVQFYDATDYVNIGNFTGTVSRTFSVPLPTTSEVSGQSATTTGQTLTPVVSGKYYEGLYNISLDVTVNYTNSIHSWLTLYYTKLTQETIDIRQVPTQTQIVTKMNAFRADVDAYKEKNDTQFEILSEEYDIAVALYAHLIARFETNTLDGTQPLLEELLSILEPYNGIYSYKTTQLTPFSLNSIYITSVGLTMPSAFTVTNSPIVGAGTINVTGAGTANQYIAGNGSLVPFPTTFTAENMVTYGRNSTGSTLHRGTIVYISGSTGNVPNFTKAQANGEGTSARTFGVVKDDISNNSDGYVVSIGTVSNLDTRSNATYPFTSDTLVDGDTVYLDPNTAGYITRVKPSAPNHLVYIGKVIRTTPTNGTIVYQIQNGYEIEELHNVQITSVANENILIYDSATSLWKNKNIFGTQGYFPYYDDTLYLKDSVLFTNGTNVGIKTANPTTSLELNGSYKIGGTSEIQSWVNQVGNTITTTPISLLIQPTEIVNTTGSGITSYGIASSISSQAASAANVQVIGGSFNVRPYGTSTGYMIGTAVQAFAIRNNTSDISTNATNSLIGLNTNVGHQSSVNTSILTSNVYGVTSTLLCYRGTITNMVGEFISAIVGISANDTALVTSYYGVRASATVGATSGTGTGTITNYYDLYLEGATIRATGIVTNKWSIYQLNSAYNNYFAGNVLIGTNTNAGFKLDVNGSARFNSISLSALNTAPASATATGVLGEVRIDASYIYVCTATNTWKRSAITTW